MAFSFLSGIGIFDDFIVVTSGSNPFSSIETNAACWETILVSIGTLQPMHLSTYVVASNTFTTRFWTICHQIRTCRSSHFTTSGFKLWIPYTSSGSVPNFGNSRRSLRYFRWGFKQSSLIYFGCALVSTKLVVGCSIVFSRLNPVRTLRVGFARNFTSAGGISNSISLSTVLNSSFSLFMLTIFAIFSTPWATRSSELLGFGLLPCLLQGSP